MNSRLRGSPPAPAKDEPPASYADRVGCWHVAGVPEKYQKSAGQYLTPLAVADFMARHYEMASASPVVTVLDPGAGAGVLSCALCQIMAAGTHPPRSIELTACETDGELARHLEACLAYARDWLQERGVTLRFTIDTRDFVLSHASALVQDTCFELPLLFEKTGIAEVPEFDVVISNPPYFKIPKSDPRAGVAAAVVHGQPNIYALFMAVAGALLKPGGDLIFLTPRSYTAGPYFQLFRQRFFSLMQPKALHLFASRKDAFGRDEVLQENLILHARRRDGGQQDEDAVVEVSISQGVRDLEHRKKRCVYASQVLDLDSKEKVLRVPLAEDDDQAARRVASWPGSLQRHGWAISTGPVVPFRAIPFLCQQGLVPQTHAPLLWMQNVTAMRMQWPLCVRGKQQFFRVEDEARSRLVPNQNYVLLRRFSAKEEARRLVAAPYLARSLDSPWLALENHLNYVHCPGGTLSEAETCGLAALLNSTLLDTYFRAFNGNTQVSATEIRAMPLPSLNAIRAIGHHVLELGSATELDFRKALPEIDALIDRVLPFDATAAFEKANV